MEQDDEITPLEAEELLEAFNLFDRDGDAEISVKELPSVIRYLGQNPTNAELEQILQDADADGSGTLNFEEYEKLIRRYTVSQEVLKTELRQAFLVLDKDKNGWLPKKRLGDWLKSVREPLSPEDTKAILDAADSNGDGTIDCECGAHWRLSVCSSVCQRERS